MPAGVVEELPLFDEPGVFPEGVVAGGPVVVPSGLVEDWPGVFPAGVVAGGPGVFPVGVVADVPVSEFDVLPEWVLEVDPGLVIDAQNIWTDSPCPPFTAAAAASKREKATDDNAFPLVALADTCEYAVHKPNSLAVVEGAANAVLRP